jgi:hypothetical protein
MIRRIRDLLYDQGFTISGARNKMQEILQTERDRKRNGEVLLEGVEVIEISDSDLNDFENDHHDATDRHAFDRLMFVRRELFEIRNLLSLSH